jgi:hypothetical protein
MEDRSQDLLSSLLGVMTGTMLSASAERIKESIASPLEEYKQQEEKKIQLLQAILDELKAIREDAKIVKEALLFHPDGPGAEAARQHFHTIL